MSDKTQQAIVTVAQKLDMDPLDLAKAVEGMATVLEACNRLAVQGGWWHHPETGEPLQRNKGELLCLIHSEVSEAMEGERKNLMDDKLKHRKMAEVELADAMVRIGDYGGGFGYSVAEAMIEKMAFNISRADHKPENRMKAGGKSF